MFYIKVKDEFNTFVAIEIVRNWFLFDLNSFSLTKTLKIEIKVNMIFKQSPGGHHAHRVTLPESRTRTWTRTSTWSRSSPTRRWLLLWGRQVGPDRIHRCYVDDESKPDEGNPDRLNKTSWSDPKIPRSPQQTRLSWQNFYPAKVIWRIRVFAPELERLWENPIFLFQWQISLFLPPKKCFHGLSLFGLLPIVFITN